MNSHSSPKWRLQTGLSVAAFIAALCLTAAGISTAADETGTNSLRTSKTRLAAKADKKEKAEKSDEKKPAKAKLTGAELYAMHCNRCHPERYATERTAAQWKTIMLHMRVRANLPAEQAKAILKYLQEDSGK